MWIACTRSGEHVPPDTPVILISVDTLRSDHLPVYGYHKVKTPAFDAFAEDATVYTKAFSHVPLTLPSHATMMTGLLPASHGVRDNTSFFLPEDAVTLADRFRDRGYQTAAVVSSMVLRQATGIDQGFDFFDDDISKGKDAFVNTYAYRKGDGSLQIVRHWLEQEYTSSQPFFLFFHLFDPHTPYDPPEPFSSDYTSKYDGEIAFTDSLLATFFQDLKKRGIYDRALIILTADHGEGLGDHIELEHGMFLYREVLQVPLMIKLPDQAQSHSVVETPVGLFDIAATIGEVLGFDGWNGEGTSILHEDEIPQRRSILGETLFPELHYGWYRQSSAIQGNLHYLEGFEGELYDMESDPAEQDNLVGQQEVPDALEDALASMQEGETHTIDVTPEELAQLESLGYVGTIQLGDDIKSLRPEEIISLNIDFRECLRLLDLGKNDLVQVKLTELLGEFPTMLDARALLASVLRPQHKYAEIDELLAEGLALFPDDVKILTYLAEARFKLGDPETALSLTRQAMEQDALFAGKVLLPLVFRHDNDALTSQLAHRMVAQESHPYAGYVLGQLSMKKRKFEEAVKHFAQSKAWLSSEDSGLRGPLLNALGDAYVKTGHIDKATSVLQEALDMDPDNVGARLLLASLWDESDLPRKASLLEEGLQGQPNQVDLLLELVVTKLKLKKEEDAFRLAQRALDLDVQKSAGPVSFFFLSRAAPNRASDLARYLLRIEPTSPYGFHVLGRVAHAQKDFDAALDWLEKARDHLPPGKDDALLAETCFYLGDAYANRQQAKQAALYFNRAVQAKPNYPEAQVSLAALYVLVGQQERARETLDRWLAAFPTKENYRQTRQLLAQFGMTEFAKSYDKEVP